MIRTTLNDEQGEHNLRKELTLQKLVMAKVRVSYKKFQAESQLDGLEDYGKRSWQRLLLCVENLKSKRIYYWTQINTQRSKESKTTEIALFASITAKETVLGDGGDDDDDDDGDDEDDSDSDYNIHAITMYTSMATGYVCFYLCIWIYMYIC